jgi:hypothetical protein
MAQAKVGRNDLCACGSGKKFKKCCESKGERSRGAMLMALLIVAVLAAGVIASITSFSGDAAHTAATSGVWDPVHGHYH